MRLPTPIVVASRCLGFDTCRYDGDIVRADVVSRLAGHVRVIPVCPELEIGLGVPRPAIRLVRDASGDRLIQPETGRDLTDDMNAFAARFLEWIAERGVDGFILKSHSPSCGGGDAKVFTGVTGDAFAELDEGLFARAARARFPDAAMEDEARLADAVTRHEFVTALYENAARRLGRKLPKDWHYPAALG
ncbi:MAG TPA: DUF523 domain-containing protein [Candidatus Krumholzibacteria bacterium]|nr:DUF523 domain-containing protein [Candidatus Krumholzibacteria bacterium]